MPNKDPVATAARLARDHNSQNTLAASFIEANVILAVLQEDIHSVRHWGYGTSDAAIILDDAIPESWPRLPRQRISDLICEIDELRYARKISWDVKAGQPRGSGGWHGMWMTPS